MPAQDEVIDANTVLRALVWSASTYLLDVMADELGSLAPGSSGLGANDFRLTSGFGSFPDSAVKRMTWGNVLFLYATAYEVTHRLVTEWLTPASPAERIIVHLLVERCQWVAESYAVDGPDELLHGLEHVLTDDVAALESYDEDGEFIWTLGSDDTMSWYLPYDATEEPHPKWAN